MVTPCGCNGAIVNEASLQRGLFVRHRPGFDPSRSQPSALHVTLRCGLDIKVGAVWRPEDMPFDGLTGSVPDLMIDPSYLTEAGACVSSELTACALACVTGDLGGTDATPFSRLPAHGARGFEVDVRGLANGRVGAPLGETSTCGPLFVALDYSVHCVDRTTSDPDDRARCTLMSTLGARESVYDGTLDVDAMSSASIGADVISKA
jgi:hypothetical protein